MQAAFDAANYVESAELFNLVDDTLNAREDLWPAQAPHSGHQVDSTPIQETALARTAWNGSRPDSRSAAVYPSAWDGHHARHIAPPQHSAPPPAHAPSYPHLPPHAPRSHAPSHVTHQSIPDHSWQRAPPALANGGPPAIRVGRTIATFNADAPAQQAPRQVQHAPGILPAVMESNKNMHRSPTSHRTPSSSQPTASSATTPSKRARAESRSDVTAKPANKVATPPSRMRAAPSGAVSGQREEADKENAAPFPMIGSLEGGDEEGDDADDEEVEEDADQEEELGDLKDSDVDAEDGEGSGPAGARRSKWLQADRTKLYEYILGSDADDIFALLQVNRKRVFKKAVAILAFSGEYTATAAQKHFARALQTYRWIVAATGTTGGAGDVDAGTDRMVAMRKFTSQLTKARKQGWNIGKLSAKIWEQWRSAGWMEMFRPRYSGDARMARAVERNSSTPIAARNATPDQGTDQLDPSRAKSKPGTPLGGEKLHDILQQKIQSDMEDRQVRQAEAAERLKISRERLELEKNTQANQFRLDVMKAAENSNILNNDTKVQMNEWVRNHFK
ncbi:hypothetical protein LXA43DRAFT_1069880 [Ganoderma leucocontextum]|nr:hypothetical protein LXA43DRAFT_1069880 [Ganoderma leucocontextum]